MRPGRSTRCIPCPLSPGSTYAHCVEMGKSGPVRIESMFPLGQSGNILAGSQGEPIFDANFYTMTPVFDFSAIAIFRYSRPAMMNVMTTMIPVSSKPFF